MVTLRSATRGLLADKSLVKENQGQKGKRGNRVGKGSSWSALEERKAVGDAALDHGLRGGREESVHGEASVAAEDEPATEEGRLEEAMNERCLQDHPDVEVDVEEQVEGKQEEGGSERDEGLMHSVGLDGGSESNGEDGEEAEEARGVERGGKEEDEEKVVAKVDEDDDDGNDDNDVSSGDEGNDRDEDVEDAEEERGRGESDASESGSESSGERDMDAEEEERTRCLGLRVKELGGKGERRQALLGGGEQRPERTTSNGSQGLGDGHQKPTEQQKKPREQQKKPKEQQKKTRQREEGQGMSKRQEGAAIETEEDLLLLDNSGLAARSAAAAASRIGEISWRPNLGLPSQPIFPLPRCTAAASFVPFVVRENFDSGCIRLGVAAGEEKSKSGIKANVLGAKSELMEGRLTGGKRAGVGGGKGGLGRGVGGGRGGVVGGEEERRRGEVLLTREMIGEEGREKLLTMPPRDPTLLRRQARKSQPATAGGKWFDMPAPVVTPELKRDLRLLKLRSVMDPKRHYKAPDSTKFPKHFQVGTVVEGAADFFSGRLARKERKQSIGEELLHDSSLTAFRKRKYTEIQDEKDRGSKRHRNRQKELRKPSWARK